MISIGSNNESRVEASDSHTPTSSSAEKAVANGDVLTEILIRLPVKSLLRFKSVSKNWNSLISSPHVARLRNPDPCSVSGLFLHPTKHGTCLFRWSERTKHLNLGLEFIPLKNGKAPAHEPDDHDASIKSLTRFPNLSDVIVLNSCHGLLFCLGYNEVEGKGGHHILNPTTKQFKTLPQPHQDGLEDLCLAYDPSESPHYKVVGLWRSVSISQWETYYHIEIYSSETGSWRPSGNSYTVDEVDFPETSFHGGVYWNGAVNWLNLGPGDSLYFHIDQERLGTIPMPPAPHGKWWYDRAYMYYGKSRGHLHLIEMYNQTTRLTVYEMERDYSGWFVKYNVDIATVGIAFPELVQIPNNWYIGCSVLDIVREESDEESYMVISVGGKFVEYRLVDGSFKTICDASQHNDGDDPLLYYHWCNSHEYIESLSCI